MQTPSAIEIAHWRVTAEQILGEHDFLHRAPSDPMTPEDFRFLINQLIHETRSQRTDLEPIEPSEAW